MSYERRDILQYGLNVSVVILQCDIKFCKQVNKLHKRKVYIVVFHSQKVNLIRDLM